MPKPVNPGKSNDAPGQQKNPAPTPPPAPAPVPPPPVPAPVPPPTPPLPPVIFTPQAKGKRHHHDHDQRPKPRVLFLLKKGGIGPYSGAYGYSTSSGLANSCKFVVDALVAAGIDAQLEVVVDNNDIDRVVNTIKPTHVIIEALWVVPEKFDVLMPLHPKVTWCVLLHSEIPFLAQEGIALTWIQGYLKRGITLGLNSDRTARDFRELAPLIGGDAKNVVLLSNSYPLPQPDTPFTLNSKDTVDVGCFGAIRPLKNQLIQAVAAVQFASRRELGLRFHINAGRVEQNGNSALANIRGLFAGLPSNFQLVEHPWMPHDQFVQLVRTMDIGLQCSFSESFNIVTADFVANGVPVVTSGEIRWVDPTSWANETDVDDIADTMNNVIRLKRVLGGMEIPQRKLANFCDESLRAWRGWLRA